MSDFELPRARVKRRPWNLARIGSRFSDGLAEIEAQREPFAEFWDDHNAAAMREQGPLWVALGDSLAQGIGASRPERGFVPNVVHRLREVSGEPWRVINLAMTGARISHVVDEELSTLHRAGLDPMITTCMIGFNDFIGGTSAASIAGGARTLVELAPHGTLVGRVSTRRLTRRATVLKDAFREGHDSGKITLFDPWDWPDATDVWARDRIHLNDNGHRHLGASVLAAMVAHGAVT